MYDPPHAALRTVRRDPMHDPNSTDAQEFNRAF